MLLKSTENKKGYTLIEVVLTLAIIGIVFVLVFNFIGFGAKFFSNSETRSKIQNEINIAAYTISNTLRNVKGISTKETYDTGFSIFDIRSKFPKLDNVRYEVLNNNGIYSLRYTLSIKEYTVQSEILLNNIESAVIGTSNDFLWIMINE